MTETLMAVLKALTVVVSIGLIFSLVPTYIRIHKDKTTGDFSVAPAATIYFSCSLWVVYGCLVGNFVPVVTVDSVGTTVGAIFMAMFYKYTPNRPYVLKLWIALACAQIVIISWVALVLSDVIHQRRRQVEIIIGFINASIDIIMYSSPLATLVHVVRIKDATSIPLTMSVVSLFNTVLWVIISTDDLFLAIPNGLGCVFSVIGIVAYIIYRPGKYQPPSEAHTPESDAYLQEIRLDATDKSNFVELSSPVVPSTTKPQQ